MRLCEILVGILDWFLIELHTIWRACICCQLNFLIGLLYTHHKSVNLIHVTSATYSVREEPCIVLLGMELSVLNLSVRLFGGIFRFRHLLILVLLLANWIVHHFHLIHNLRRDVSRPFLASFTQKTPSISDFKHN